MPLSPCPEGNVADRYTLVLLLSLPSFSALLAFSAPSPPPTNKQHCTPLRALQLRKRTQALSSGPLLVLKSLKLLAPRQSKAAQKNKSSTEAVMSISQSLVGPVAHSTPNTGELCHLKGGSQKLDTSNKKHPQQLPALPSKP